MSILTKLFHEGELTLQKKYNATHNLKMIERIFKDYILDHLIDFIENQTTLILSTLDNNDNIWASMLIGELGVIKVTSSKTIHIDIKKLKSTKTDILFQNIENEARIGMLLIDTVSRTRYRINGSAHISNNILIINVLQAYSNCPKYIQQRVPKIIKNPSELGVQKETGKTLKNSHKTLIKEADTFFLASINAVGDMDASHRGGNKGFIELLEDDTLKIPDYTGNNLFNTFGNFLQNPKCGLVFMDFKKRYSLQLSGNATLLLDQQTEKDIEITAGTGRYWLFKADQWILTQNHNAIDWEFVDFSPFNP